METALHDAAATLPAACACFEFPKQWCRSAGVATTTHPRVCTVFAPVVARAYTHTHTHTHTHTYTRTEATNKCRRPAYRTKRERKSETRIGLIKASKQCWMPPMAQQRVVSQITVRHVAHRCASNAEQCPIPLRASLSPRSLYPTRSILVHPTTRSRHPPLSRLQLHTRSRTCSRRSSLTSDATRSPPRWTITPPSLFVSHLATAQPDNR